jgi:hypothetical protein
VTGDTHYDLEVLAELAEGLLDAATAMRVREHLAICDPCGESLADLAAVRELLAATPTPAMPMGVALRIDRALAAEAENFRGGGIGLVEAPAWDDMMRDAPWEAPPLPAPEPELTAPEPESEREIRPEPVPVPRLGVVGDDGTVVPVTPAKRRRTAGRRRWASVAAVAGVAAAVAGVTVVTTSMLSAAGPQPKQMSALPAPSAAPAYQLTDSNWNYTDKELRGSLMEYISPAPVLGTAATSELTRCVQQVSAKVGKQPFAVDRGFYNGQEANIVLFWHDKDKNRVRVHVVGPSCENVRKPALAGWR